MKDLKLELTLRIPVQYALHHFLDFLFKTTYVVNITATIIRVFTSCSVVVIFHIFTCIRLYLRYIKNSQSDHHPVGFMAQWVERGTGTHAMHLIVAMT